MWNARNPVWKRRLGPGALAALIWLVAAGCAVGPDFEPPRAAVPVQWTGPAPGSTALPATPAEEDLARWWKVFQDPVLTSLVERAVRSNLDLMQAEARIRQARASRAIAASGIWPSIDAGASYSRGRYPAATAAGGTDRVTSTQYQAGFDAGWELDIFGGIRRGVEAADADLLGTIETRRDVLVTLTAEVARNYIDFRAFQQRIVIARHNLKTQRHSAGLTRQRFEGGFVSGLDVANAEAQSSTTESQIPLLEASARQSIYSLGVLLGLEPGALIEELTPVSPIPGEPPAVPVGVPSDLVRRRPDIRKAEADIHAATARIGVATADLFPKFTILGSAGFQGNDLSSAFSWSGHFWSLLPSASWRVFDAGRIRASIELQKAIEEENVISYRRTVLTALQEVENALIASVKEQERRRALVTAVAANRKAVALATTLYTEGQADFLNVLDAQRSLFVTEEALAQSSQNVSTSLVALYKALGGGWSDEQEAAGK